MSIKHRFCCLSNMKKAKPPKAPLDKDLPFSFSRKDVDDEKINAHWEKIKGRIARALPVKTDKETRNN